MNKVKLIQISKNIVLNQGTETGHASGTQSHWNGYKLDISLNTCNNNHIQSKTLIQNKHKL